MDRRCFLTGATAAAGLSVVDPAALVVADDTTTGRVKRVAVIGAGIVGASIAYNLTQRGCDVILIEKREPAAQASGNSFAWINASYFDTPKSYFTLRTHALSEHHHLAQQLDLSTRWDGGLEWYHSAERAQEVATGVRRIQAYGSPTRMLSTAEVADLEPNLQLGGERDVAYSPRDGAMDAAAATRALVYGVVTNGGTALYPAAVNAISSRPGGVVVETTVDDFEVDLVVIAAGTEANNVAAMAGLVYTLVKPATPGIIVTTKPMESLVHSVLYTTDTHIHQLHDGRVVIGEKGGPP